MRALCAVAASFLASIAAVVASFGEPTYVQAYIGLAFCATCAAAASGVEPLLGFRRRVVQAAAGVWAIAALWIAALAFIVSVFVMSSGPPPVPDMTFVGIPETAYYLVGLYGGTLLMLLAARMRLPGARVPATGRPAPGLDDGALSETA